MPIRSRPLRDCASLRFMQIRPRKPPRSIGFLLIAPRHWIGAGIATFFLTMLLLLWRREAGLVTAARKLGISPDYLTAIWMDYEQTVWIERAGERIGAYLLQIRRDEATGTYNFLLRSRLKLGVMNVELPVELDLAVGMGERFEMQTVQGRLHAAEQAIAVDGFVEGLGAYYRVQGPPTLLTGGGLTARAALQEPVILADAIRPLVTQNRRLKVGNKWTLLASDPIGGRYNLRVTVEVAAREMIEFEGKEIAAFRLIERGGETETTSWYDLEGKLLKTDLGNGLMLIRAELKDALELYPDLKRPPRFAPLDREAIRREALASLVK